MPKYQRAAKKNISSLYKVSDRSKPKKERTSFLEAFQEVAKSSQLTGDKTDPSSNPSSNDTFNPKQYSRRVSGYNVFSSTLRNQSIKSYGSQWQKLSKEEKENFEKEAMYKNAQMSLGSFDYDSISPKQKQRMISKNIQSIVCSCDILGKLGIVVGGLAINSSQIIFFGSEEGERYVREDEQFQKRFAVKCLQRVNMPEPPNPADTLAALQRKVQQIYNDKYSLAVGKQCRVSYKHANKFEVKGLPKNVEFKKPSRYGKKICNQIIAQEEAIEISIRPEAEAPTELETASETEPHSDAEPAPAPADEPLSDGEPASEDESACKNEPASEDEAAITDEEHQRYIQRVQLFKMFDLHPTRSPPES